uniref:Uncharacterized protein n=1 Tax=Methylophaga nitratireducenticrescens TaxID=754476 RepID=I1XMD1_METNJ
MGVLRHMRNRANVSQLDSPIFSPSKKYPVKQVFHRANYDYLQG